MIISVAMISTVLIRIEKELTALARIRIKLQPYLTIKQPDPKRICTDPSLPVLDRIPDAQYHAPDGFRQRANNRTGVVYMKTIWLAGGCFWGMQQFFDQFEGVLRTEVGYANGPDRAPSYEDVCADSGHAETLQVDYDENTISLTSLLGYYFMAIDPLSVNRQGHDEGIQYRTGVYYTDESLLPEIEAVYRAEEEKAGAKLAVELEPLRNFFPAEEYHQKYLVKNPGGYCHIPRSLLGIAKRGE